MKKETKRDPKLQALLFMLKNGWPDSRLQVPVEATGHTGMKLQQQMVSFSKEHV